MYKYPFWLTSADNWSGGFVWVISLANEIEFTTYLLTCTYYLEKSFLFIFLYSASFIKQNLYKSMWEVKFIAEAKSDLYCQRLTPSFVLNYIQKCQKSVQRRRPPCCLLFMLLNANVFLYPTLTVVINSVLGG